jgi:hypothetical protein
MKKWFTLMLIIFAARAGAYTIPHEEWMGTFVGEAKVGWMVLDIDHADFEGTKGYKITTAVNNHLFVLGADMTQVIDTVVYTDSNYVPLKEVFSMSSGGKTTTVSAKFTAKSIECDVSTGSSSSKKSIPIPEGSNLVADPLFGTSDTFPEVGKQYFVRYFDPLTLSLDDLNVKVEKREKITVRGKDYDTVMLANVTPLGNMTVWQEADGSIVQVKGMMGITMTRMTRAEAIASDGAGTAQDLAVLTNAKSDKPIARPRECKSLAAVLVGIDDPNMLITDSRQTASALEGKPDSAKFVIKAARFDEAKSAQLPVSSAALHECLIPTPYVDSDAKPVIEQAKQIIGSELNAYRACAKIRAWIHANLKVKSDIGITRSASDVLESKVGVCRDYAILFAALARSAHVPSKVVSGLIYTEGAFYYHAWVECYVGKWVPFDATLATDFVDATHIKLAEGDATTMFSLAKVIGALRVEVKQSK